MGITGEMAAHMVRRVVLAIASLGLSAIACLAHAVDTSGNPVVGVLLYTNREVHSPADRAFRQALAALGYDEGRNLSIVYRWADKDPARLQKAAAELVQMRVDVIVVGSLPALRAARAATGEIAIVMGSSSDPVAEGVVSSLAHPGENVTGVAVVTTPEIAGKRLALLKEAAPRLSRVGVLFNPDDPTNVAELTQAEVAARTLGVELRKLDVQGKNPVQTAFSALDKRAVDGLMVIYSIETHEHRAAIAEEAIKRRLPAIGAESFAAAGGLLSYGTEAYATWRRAAEYVSKILRGAIPAALPIEQESRFFLVVNLRTAKRLSLSLPQSLTLRADEVIR